MRRRDAADSQAERIVSMIRNGTPEDQVIEIIADALRNVPPARPPSTSVLDEYIGPGGMGDGWHMSYNDGVWCCYINGAPESLRKHTGKTAELARFAAAWEIYRSSSLLETSPWLGTQK